MKQIFVIIKYSLEFVLGIFFFRKHLNDVAKKFQLEASVLKREKFYKISSLGVIGLMLYDYYNQKKVYCCKKEKMDERRRMKVLIAYVLLLQDICDMIIDERKELSNKNDKTLFLFEIKKYMIFNNTREFPYSQSNQYFLTVKYLCDYIRENYFNFQSTKDKLDYSDFANNLIGLIGSQMGEQFQNKLLLLDMNIGETCVESLIRLVNKDFTNIEKHQPFINLGAYCQLKDNFYDRKKDLMYNVNTYVTSLMKSGLSDYEIKQFIDEKIKNLKNCIYFNLLHSSEISQKQKRIFYALKLFIDVKFF